MRFNYKRYKRPTSRGFISFEIILLIFLIGLIGFIFIKRQEISDWWKLRGYTPPTAITQLAIQDTMMPNTQHLFYLNKPELLSSVSSFRLHCPENEDIIVLGCYHSGQNGIFIYNVQDPTLYGVAQVTAAHEVLHAVYERLSSSARNNLDYNLQYFYDHDLTNPQVKAEILLYKQTEPGSVYDEMSCTFGTELANLSPALNAYYSNYFYNRLKIVNFEQSYQGQLVSRQNTISSDDSTLSNIKSQISANESSLQNLQTNLSSEQANLLSVERVNPDQYNSMVPGYNQQVDQYNSLLSTTTQLINQYNDLVNTRNAVAVQLTTLDSALDTRLQPQTKQ